MQCDGQEPGLTMFQGKKGLVRAVNLTLVREMDAPVIGGGRPTIEGQPIGRKEAREVGYRTGGQRRSSVAVGRDEEKAETIVPAIMTTATKSHQLTPSSTGRAAAWSANGKEQQGNSE